MHLLEAAGGGHERLADGQRGHHHVGRRPAGLLGDLVGERLLALVLVGVAGGAAVEEEAVLDEPVPEGDEVVVDAPVDHEIGRGGGHVQQLGRRRALVGEDQRAQPGPGRVRGDRRACVARGDDRRRREAELQRRRHRGRRGAVLHGAGRIRAFVLEREPPDAELPGEPRTVEQRRGALAEGDALGRIGDRQHRGVAPQAGAAQAAGAVAPQAVEVVDQLEQTAALVALQPVAERVDGAAVDAGQMARQRLGVHFPKRSWMTASISSTRWRRVCSASARRRALAPIARASSGRCR